MSELKQKSTSRNQSRNKKNAKTKKHTSKSPNRQKRSKDKSIENSISSLIDQFDSLFIDKDSAFDKKKIKEFARNSLIMKDGDDEESSSINYRNFIIVLLKMCGLGIDLEDEDEKEKFVTLVPSSSVYTSEKELDSLIADLKIRRDKIKNKLLTNNLNEIITQVYNIFDFNNNSDFKKFKEFMRAIFKLTQNHTRKIRIIGTMIMCKITELLVAEYGKNKKLLKQEELKHKNGRKSANKNQKIEDSNYRMRYNLCNNLAEYINDIKKNFIMHKICDYSKEIRSLLCDMMERISKHYFNIIFGEFNLVEYFNFFLQDPSNAIRVKYLQIIYDRLNAINDTEDPEIKKSKKMDEYLKPKDDIEKENQDNSKDISKTTKLSSMEIKDEELKESMEIIIEILNKTKATILTICVKEDTFLAKSGIKILELLSKQNILETKTVNNLLLHLFNEEPKIRSLIAQITINYILNFEQPNDDGIIAKPCIEHVHFLNQLALRLTGKINNMMNIFVQDFFNELKIIKNYKLLFDYVNHLLNQDEIEFNLLQNILMLIDNSIKIVRNKIDEYGQTDYIKKHDEFCEELINRMSEFLKKLRFIKNDKDTRHNTQYDLINSLLQLLQNFKLYPASSYNIHFETVKQILFELKKTFFISTSIYNNNTNKSNKNENSELDIDDSDDEISSNKHKKRIKQSQSTLTEEKIIENYIKSNYSSGTEKLCENILRGMSSILNDQKLFELFNYNDTQIVDQVIYSSNDKDNKECLAYIFFKTFQEQIISHPYYSEIAQNSGSNDISEISKLISENYDENIIYILINQFNQLIIYFPKIFTDVGGINLYEFEHFLISILRCKIQKLNNDDIKILEFNYNYIISLLNIIDTIHLRLFNNNVEFKENINEYIEIRNRIITMLFYIMSISYSPVDEKSYNSFLYLIKGKCLGLFLDIYMITTHEKLQVRELQYDLIPNLMSIFYIFVRNNFIRFLWQDYRENFIINKDDESEDDEENNTKKKTKKEKSKNNEKTELFWSNYKLQVYVLKIFAEKFSRLLLVNFKTFLNEPLCLLYFETFFLLPQNSIITQITEYTAEVLMTKELNQYKKFLEEKEKDKEKNNNNTSYNNTEEGKIFLILYYMNKIVLRIFNNDSQLFNDENNPKPFSMTYEEKQDMCQRYLNTYIRISRKLKQKYAKENPALIEKDKIPYENFILNGIAFALDKSNVVNETTSLENVYFLDFIKMYIKNGIFVDEEMIHDIIITYIKLAKKWEITENMNLIHIRFMEKFKAYILNKGHMKIVENKSSKGKDEENENDKDEDEEKEDKDEKEDKEKDEEDNQIESNPTTEKKKKENKKRKSVKKKKRAYNEVIKEENEEDEEPKKRVRKSKKEG